MTSIIILPGTVLFLIPGVLIYRYYDSTRGIPFAGIADLRFWMAIIFALPGLTLAIWTSALFVKVGEGTPAPWDPPKRLVIRGPYRHIRNPMILGVLLMLSAESLFFGSWPILLWTLLFFAGNTIYFKYSEEPGLVKRYGDDYLAYKKHVRRWLPRIRPYD